MFASTLFADENDVRDFDQQIQNLMRTGRADEAAAILETALGAIGQAGHRVAALCLSCPVETIEITGWDALAERIAGLDRPAAPIAALGIDMSWPGHVGLEPDENGCLEPYLETNFYNDSAFPFTKSDRAALLQGYSSYGANWQGMMADIDTLLGVRGLGHLYGTVYPLVEEIRATPAPDPLDADAMRLGAAFVAVRLHQAVARAVRLHGLPRPLTVIVGSNESYPFYDAPVFDTIESQEFAQDEVAEVAVEDRAVEPETVDIDAPETDESSDATTDEDRIVQISGAALRQRLGQQNAGGKASNQSLAASGGLLRRLFAR